MSGNRLFGFTDNGDGTYSFYTRGVDRLSTSFYDWGNWLSGGLAFSNADELWSSFQEKIKDEIGSNATLESTTYRPDYNKVEGVLNGTESPTTLGCN